MKDIVIPNITPAAITTTIISEFGFVLVALFTSGGSSIDGEEPLLNRDVVAGVGELDGLEVGSLDGALVGFDVVKMDRLCVGDGVTFVEEFVSEVVGNFDP